MAETTTISNLQQITIDELTNDTIVPVENVDGTKAANLAQLRKKLNSLYVEMVDADLNELKQDGIYECWGTTLNAPTSEVAAWIIQTAEHEGVVVQNAFGLGTTSYSYVYRRRWYGVSWTAWENKIHTLETVKANVDLSNLSEAGQAKFDAKANVSNTVTTNTEQAITGTKTFKSVVTAELEQINFIAKNPTMDVNQKPSSKKYVGYDFRDKNNVRLGYIGISQSTDGSFIYEIQTLNGLASAIYGITPASATENSKAIPTTAWIANQHKRGDGIGLPNYASPTTLSWGTSYTSATAPQVNGWLYFGGTSTDSDYLLLTMNGFTFNAGAISGAAGFHTLFIPYRAKTAFSTSGGTSGQFLKFFSSL